jgi:hypothetical protein
MSFFPVVFSCASMQSWTMSRTNVDDVNVFLLAWILMLKYNIEQNSLCLSTMMSSSWEKQSERLLWFTFNDEDYCRIYLVIKSIVTTCYANRIIYCVINIRFVHRTVKSRENRSNRRFCWRCCATLSNLPSISCIQTVYTCYYCCRQSIH